MKGQGCDSIAADKYLASLFRNGDYISYDSTNFRDFDKTLHLIETPLLNKLLPNYCFYSTTFLSHYYEYFDVETVVAYSNKEDEGPLLMHSPVFTKESKRFMSLFCGLKTFDTAQSVALAKEITNIFSAITYEGHFNRLVNLKEKGVISFELWHTDLSWRIYDFYFDNNNKLTQIEIHGGVKRQEMWEGYKRQ